jgi:hypothetical protein
MEGTCEEGSDGPLRALASRVRGAREPASLCGSREGRAKIRLVVAGILIEKEVDLQQEL